MEADANDGLGGAHTGELHQHKHIVEDMIRSVELAAHFEESMVRETSSGRRTWLAIRLVRLHCYLISAG
jgi:proline dehydrogenase